MPSQVSYAVGYAFGRPKPCIIKDCVEGGQLLQGQLRFTVVQRRERDGREFIYWRHLSCVSDSLRSSIPKKISGAAEIRGFNDLTSGDKSRVNEVFGWTEEVSAQSPEGGDAWGEDIETRYESSSERPPSSADLIQIADSKQAEHETVESQFEEVLDAEKRREDDYEDEEGCHVVFDEPPKRTDSRNVPVRNSIPKPKPRLPTESTAPHLALLELEEKEARVRLAEAELRVAEACAKVEAARYSVIEHKLKMARAGMKP